MVVSRLVRAIKEAPGVPLSDGRTAIILTDEVRSALQEAEEPEGRDSDE